MVSHSTTFKDLASFKDGFDIQGVNTYGTDPSLLVRLQNNTARVFCRSLAYFKNMLAGGASVPYVLSPCIIPITAPLLTDATHEWQISFTFRS